MDEIGSGDRAGGGVDESSGVDGGAALTADGASASAVDGSSLPAVAVVVERVEAMVAGPALAATLGTLDHSLLDDDQALTVTAAWMRLQAWAEAGQVRGLATFVDRRARLDADAPWQAGGEAMVRMGGAGTPEVEEFAAAEAGAVLGIGTGAARGRIADAVDLRHRLPSTFAALRLGHVDGSKARLMARGTRLLSAVDAGRVDAEIADLLSGWTWRRCDREITRAVVAADPAGAERRRDEARAAREVVVGPSRDGVREVLARLDAGPAARLDARVDQVAGWLGELGDTDRLQVRRATALGVLADPDEVVRVWDRLCAHRRRTAADDATGGDADHPDEPQPRPEQPTADGTTADGTTADGTTADAPTADAPTADAPTADAPTTAGPSTDNRSTGRPVPATVLYLHLRRDETGAARWEQAAREGRCPLTPLEARDLLGTSHVTLRPVLDLAAVPRSPGYRPSRRCARRCGWSARTTCSLSPTPPPSAATTTTTSPGRSVAPTWLASAPSPATTTGSRPKAGGTSTRSPPASGSGPPRPGGASSSTPTAPGATPSPTATGGFAPDSFGGAGWTPCRDTRP